MMKNVSRRNWLKYLSAGMGGLILSEQKALAAKAPEQPFNADLAMVALALARLQPPNGRGQHIKLNLGVGEAMLIDETSGTRITWADGDANFDNAVTDLTALTYL